jgi:2-keto-4-pentenoate hydratase/2-oxohepta-3-ene-1,7-dioic acid hydratase in catechol pathway
VTPFFPGHIISTGTPGAVVLEPGDEVSALLGADLSRLDNPVVRESR